MLWEQQQRNIDRKKEQERRIRWKKYLASLFVANDGDHLIKMIT